MNDHIWDYNRKDLRKSKRGQILLLERLINYGIYLKGKKKISLKKVKKNWNILSIDPKRKKLFHHLIWGT